MKFNAPRGTNDILPPDSYKWQYIEKVTHELFSNYNYEEIRTPIFEYTELFQRGIGEVTDIVEKEMPSLERQATETGDWRYFLRASQRKEELDEAGNTV